MVMIVNSCIWVEFVIIIQDPLLSSPNPDKNGIDVPTPMLFLLRHCRSSKPKNEFEKKNRLQEGSLNKAFELRRD